MLTEKHQSGKASEGYLVGSVSIETLYTSQITIQHGNFANTIIIQYRAHKVCMQVKQRDACSVKTTLVVESKMIAQKLKGFMACIEAILMVLVEL